MSQQALRAVLSICLSVLVGCGGRGGGSNPGESPRADRTVEATWLMRARIQEARQEVGVAAQGHLVFGHGIAPQEENEYRVLSHVEPCFPGTLHMRQNSVLRWTAMIAQPPPLIEVFAEIPDFRRCRGKRPPLPAILSLACCAMLCGYRS